MAFYGRLSQALRTPVTDIYAIMLMINSWSRPAPVYTLTQWASYVVYRSDVHIFLKGWHFQILA